MSVWSQIEGSVVIAQSKKFSVHKSLEIFGDEISISINTTKDKNNYHHKISVSICLEGDSMIQLFKEWIGGLPSGRKDLTLTTRFLE